MRPTVKFSLLAGAAMSLGGVNVALADGEATSARSADEVRALVAEMLADAETRSSLLQAGAMAGHDGRHFTLASADGLFRLNVSGQIQFRYNMNWRDDDAPDDADPDDPDFADTDDFVPGFQTRRTKLEFGGHVFERELYYKVVGAFDRDGGDFELEDAYVGYDMGNGWTVQWGQFKLPLLREELVSSKYQLAVDRSVTNEVFNQGRSQGVQAAYEQEDWRAMAAFSDGIGSANTDLGDPTSADWALTGRFEYKFSGDWSQFRYFSSPQGSDSGLLVGAAAHYESAADTGADGDETDRFIYTIDASYVADGWNLFAALVGNDIKDGVSVADGGTELFSGDSDNFGYILQGGIFVAEQIELFGRWDHTFFDDDLATGNDELRTITAGMNYYAHGHAAKFTADVQWLLDEMPFSNTGIGILSSANEDQIVLRLQFQLLF